VWLCSSALNEGLKIDSVAYIKRLLALDDTSSLNYNDSDDSDDGMSRLPTPG
jgi:hypothetical protein